MKRRMAFIIPAAIVGVIAFMFVGGVIVLQLWNWLLPGLFGFRMITFWQALGMLALCRILFGGFGMRGGRRSGWRGPGGRFGHLTPEERERFRERMRNWAVGGASTAENQGRS